MVHEKFLKAINHMEFHPTLGKEKKGTSYRLHNAKDRDASIAQYYWHLYLLHYVVKVKQYKAQNKEIWFGYLDFRLENIQKCTLHYVH